MEFAEWVVSGLDQLRLGQLPAGNDFYATASAGLGGDPRLPAYMNSGDPAARAELVQAIAAAVAANPGFEQQLRDAAAVAMQTPGHAQDPAGGKPPFLKTTNGLLAIVAAAVIVVGGGVGLAVSLGGSGGNLVGMLKGTWNCQASGSGADGAEGPITLTVGDGTFKAGSTSGTFTQSGSTATLHNPEDAGDDIKVSGLPSGSGSFNVTVGSARDTSGLLQLHIKGTLSANKLTMVVPGDSGGTMNLTCTK
ncbi:hypothetical protein ABIA35_008827 [Catenulispora sp. MAP12-49]|uniref:hypothetical protein n=1 Tax=Catenulispora sp. MAP12-49 TaxID=3156302 RepID=UPI0035126C7E